MPYTVGLVGAGSMGRAHARQWSKMPDVKIVGIMADGHASAPALSSDLDGSPEVAGDFDQLLKTSPDIVDICAPTPHHLHYIERAAAAGKAIFCEKPLARSIEDCDSAVVMVEKAGVPAMAGHVVRFFPEFAAAKHAVHNGAIGRPAAIRTARMAGFPNRTVAENWYADSNQSGGVVLDMIVHDFDWLLWTFGPVERVFAKGLVGGQNFDQKLDYALVTLRFRSGAIAHVTGSWAHTGGFRTTFEIAGDQGIIDHDSDRAVPLSVAFRTEDRTAGTGVAVPESPLSPGDDPYYRELRAFVDALETNSTPPVTLQDAREATRIALAAIDSIQHGKVVTLP